jgi:hypothetical protein
MEDKMHSISNLTNEQLKLILESLLYTSSVDVTGNYDYSYGEKFFNIAKHIRNKNPDIITENIEVFKNENIPFSDQITHNIVKTFPETVVENFNL